MTKTYVLIYIVILLAIGGGYGLWVWDDSWEIDSPFYKYLYQQIYDNPDMKGQYNDMAKDGKITKKEYKQLIDYIENREENQHKQNVVNYLKKE